ncbi:MAG: diaminopimelate decarboxylase [Sulfitobacter sp.]
MKSVSQENLAEIASTFGTPCWVYDGDAIRRRIAQLKVFDVVRYAQKANSNTHLLRLMKSLGVVVDAVSLGEIERALAAGYDPSGGHAEIVFASDIFDRPTLSRIVELGIQVNIGSPHMLEQLGEVSPGHPVWLRINPGFGSGHSKKTNTGGESSKHGIWHENIDECYDMIDKYKLDLVGLHMHIGSGGDYENLKRVCGAMIDQVRHSKRDIRAISAGGGLPVPYQKGDAEIDIDKYYLLWKNTQSEIEKIVGHKVKLEIEPGRIVVAQSGVLLSEVRAKKNMGSNNFVLVDAGFNDLMRPAMYGSFHQVSFLQQDGKPRNGPSKPTVLAGPLCEAGDIFTQELGGEITRQELPEPEVGDLAVFHDSGAYCSSMSSNYNSRTLVPEVLIDNGETKLIRRRQEIGDLLALEDV